MAFNKETLQSLGLNEKQIQGVMAERGKELNKQKGKITETTNEADSLREQLREREKDINRLKKSNADNEALTEQLDELKLKYKKAEAQRELEVQKLRLDNAINAKLAGSNARDVDIVKGLLDKDAIKIGEDGELNGLDEQVKALQSGKKFLFKGNQQGTYQPANGQGSKKFSFEDVMKSDDVNLTEFIKRQAEG